MNIHSFDEAYVRRLAARDPETERHFAEHFRPLLVWKTRSLVRSPELGEEIVQETLMRVMTYVRERGSVAQPERFGAFVNGVCNNVYREMVRADARLRPADMEGFHAVPDETNVEGDALKTEIKRLVRATLDELETRDRQVLRRLFLEDADRDQLCLEMGIDRDHLRVVLHRAQTRFRQKCSRQLASAAGF